MERGKIEHETKREKKKKDFAWEKQQESRTKRKERAPKRGLLREKEDSQERELWVEKKIKMK